MEISTKAIYVDSLQVNAWVRSIKSLRRSFIQLSFGTLFGVALIVVFYVFSAPSLDTYRDLVILTSVLGIWAVTSGTCLVHRRLRVIEKSILDQLGSLKLEVELAKRVGRRELDANGQSGFVKQKQIRKD